MGEYYFEDVPLEEAALLIKNRPEPVHNENDLMRFLETILPPRIPLYKPPWEIYVFPDYTEKESAMILKVHHSVGDGLSG